MVFFGFSLEPLNLTRPELLRQRKSQRAPWRVIQLITETLFGAFTKLGARGRCTNTIFRSRGARLQKSSCLTAHNLLVIYSNNLVAARPQINMMYTLQTLVSPKQLLKVLPL
jgi:hypothetical protein